MTQGIQPYYGEFLVSPIPLELSLIEPCDYNCCYCFAVLGDRHHAKKTGKSQHSSAVKKAYNLLAEFRNRKTLESHLLRMGYPVLLSNRTDPFGRANRGASLPLIEVMVDLGIPIAYQTKGFAFEEDLDAVLEMAPTACWYISVAMLDDDIRRKIEPAAPAIPDRLRLIERLVEKGHSVNVGINPCVPDWLPDPRALCKELKARGVHGVWLEPLHLSRDQELGLRPKERLALGENLITLAKKRYLAPEFDEFLLKVQAIALDEDLWPYWVGYPEYSEYWYPYYERYPHLFPTTQEFVNHLFVEGCPKGWLLTYEDFAEFMLPYLPEGVLPVGHYIGATTHAICRETPNWTNQFTYDRLLEWLWSEPRIKISPANWLCFSNATAQAADGTGRLLVDESDRPIYAWNRGASLPQYADCTSALQAFWEVG